MANNLVKFVYASQADFNAATKDVNTIYFVKDGDLYKIYKGDVLYDGTSPDVAADLAQLQTYIGELPVDGQYDNLIDYIETLAANAEQNAKDYTDVLDSSLANVAKSGAAVNVSVADAGNLITATNVEGALQELAGAINTNDAAAAVTIESASGSGDVLTTYDFYQGVLQTDDAAAKAAKKLGTINIPKDYLVRSAEIETVTVADEPYVGAAVGDKYIDFVVNTKDGDTGTPSHMYIALNDLVAVMQGSTGNEISVTIGANNSIQASVNTINGNKIIYEVGTGGAPDITVNDKIAELEEAMGDGFDALDADVDAAAPLLGADAEAVGVVSGVTEVDGIITAVDTAYVDAAGAATRAKNAVIGTSGDLPGAETIYGAKAYADSLVTALDADKDAITDSTITDTEKVAVMTGITEADGVITSIDSIDVDKAGAATRAKNAVIGTSADTKTADTVYGAKAYADDAVVSALTWGTLTTVTP